MSTNDESFEGRDDKFPEIMDEHQWEAFMQESDQRTDKYMKLQEKYKDDPDAERKIDEEMGWATHDDEENDTSHYDDPSFWEDMNEFDDGEEWKELTGYKELNDIDRVQDLPVYRKNYDYSLHAYNMTKEKLHESDDPSVLEFCSTLLIPAAKIAGGFGMGFEVHTLGGNIANCKRGLRAANQSLDALFEIGQKGLLDRETYLDLQQRGKEARDELALYIQELRRRFNGMRGV